MIRILVAACLMVVGTARLADAEGRAADTLVARGLELRREGRASEALDLFERAYALAPSPRTLGQLGLAEASVGRWLDAERHLDSSLGAARDPWVQRNSALLADAMELSHQHIGQVTIIGPIGALVSIAGNPVGSLPIPAPVRVAEGNLLVTATAFGYRQLVRSVEVPGGGKVEISLTMERLDLRPREEMATPGVVPLQSVEVGDSSWRWWTAGGLFLAGAAVMTWGTIRIAIDGSHPCVGGGVCQLVYHTAKPGWIILGVGAATATAGGFVLFATHRGDAEVAVSAVPMGLQLAGRF